MSPIRKLSAVLCFLLIFIAAVMYWWVSRTDSPSQSPDNSSQNTFTTHVGSLTSSGITAIKTVELSVERSVGNTEQPGLSEIDQQPTEARPPLDQDNDNLSGVHPRPPGTPPRPSLPGLSEFKKERNELVNELRSIIKKLATEPEAVRLKQLSDWRTRNTEKLRINKEKALLYNELSIDSYPDLINLPSSPEN